MSDSNGHDESYLMVDELAKEVRVSPRTIRRWLAETDIPHRRVGTVIRFRLTEVDEWMQGRGKDEPVDDDPVHRATSADAAKQNRRAG